MEQGLALAIALLVIKEIISLVREKSRDNQKGLENNTTAIYELKTEMQLVRQSVDGLIDLKEDVETLKGEVSTIRALAKRHRPN